MEQRQMCLATHRTATRTPHGHIPYLVGWLLVELACISAREHEGCCSNDDANMQGGKSISNSVPEN
jgi:hypothetical protein